MPVSVVYSVFPGQVVIDSWLEVIDHPAHLVGAIGQSLRFLDVVTQVLAPSVERGVGISQAGAAWACHAKKLLAGEGPVG